MRGLIDRGRGGDHRDLKIKTEKVSGMPENVFKNVFLVIELTCACSGCTERALCWGSLDSV